MSAGPQQQRLIEWLASPANSGGRPAAPLQTRDQAACIGDFGRFVVDILGWAEEDLQPPPAQLRVWCLEYEEELVPTWAVAPGPGEPGPWLMLVQVLPANTDLDRRDLRTKGWRASPTTKFEHLLRETKVTLGLLVNG